MLASGDDNPHNKDRIVFISSHGSKPAKSPSPGTKGYSPFITDSDGISTEHKYDILYDRDSGSHSQDRIKHSQQPRVQLTNTSNSKGSVLHSKFVLWLFEVVQLDQYLPVFEKNGKADIRKVRHLTDKILSEMGVEDEADRELILEEVEEFKKLQAEFNKILDKNKVLRPLKSKFRANGILTIQDLHEDIQSKNDLERISGITDEDKLEQIWGIIHPSQSNLQLQINKIKKKYNVTVSYMDSLFKDLNELQMQMAATNIFTNLTSIQKTRK